MAEAATLVARCKRGDELAWEALVRQFQSRVYSVALHYMRDAEEARDVAQEVFVRVYQKIETFDSAAEEFLPWLLSVARNACIDRIRRRRARPLAHSVPVEDQPGLPDAAPSPEESVLADSRRRLLHRALAGISDVNREIILLKEIQGLEIKQIAEILSVPIGTVKSRSVRARIELAKSVLALDPSYGA